MPSTFCKQCNCDVTPIVSAVNNMHKFVQRCSNGHWLKWGTVAPPSPPAFSLSAEDAHRYWREYFLAHPNEEVCAEDFIMDEETARYYQSKSSV